MTDGSNVSQIESISKASMLPPDIKQERRSEKRLEVDKQLKATIGWLTSLDERVAKGLITNERRKQLIAGSMVAGKLYREGAEEKSKAAEEESKTDQLTKLLNRRAFDEEIQKLINSETPFGLLVIDVDEFGNFNNTFGHETGDNVLMQTAQNLTSQLRHLNPNNERNDKVFRYGGDEFVALLPGVRDEKSLENVAEKLRCSVAKSPYVIGENHIPVTISIGGAINKEKEQNTFKLADDAVYAAKDIGKNNTVILTT